MGKKKVKKSGAKKSSEGEKVYSVSDLLPPSAAAATHTAQEPVVDNPKAAKKILKKSLKKSSSVAKTEPPSSDSASFFRAAEEEIQTTAAPSIATAIHVEGDRSDEDVLSDEDDPKDVSGDEDSASWQAFGERYLDRRLARGVAQFGTKPTLVQSKIIPLALEGKDILCKAKTGSGKTIAYLVPLLSRCLEAIDGGRTTTNTTMNAAPSTNGAQTNPLAVVLVPTNELCVQVHEVCSQLLKYCDDSLTVDHLLSNATSTKAEFPSVLVCSPMTLLQNLKVRARKLDSLLMLVVDEADLICTYGYEENMAELKSFLPNRYQALLCSATLSEEVESLKSLVLHNPQILSLDDTAVEESAGGKLSQFYLPLRHHDDKWLVLYAFLRLKLVSGKILIFVKDIEGAYGLRLFLEKFGINSAVLNSELNFESRQNVIQQFNQSFVNICICTDEGFEKDGVVGESFAAAAGASAMMELEDDMSEEEGSDAEMAGEESDSSELDLDQEFLKNSTKKTVRLSTAHIKLPEPEIGSRKVHSKEIQDLKEKQKTQGSKGQGKKKNDSEEDSEEDDDDDSEDLDGIDSDDLADAVDGGFGGDAEESEVDEEEEDDEDELSAGDEDEKGAAKSKKGGTKKPVGKNLGEEEEDGFGEDFSDIEEGDGEDGDPLDADMDDEDEDDDEDDFEDSMDVEQQQSRKKAEKSADKQFSLTRGLDFKDVGTVINADLPKTIRAYVHRVGRTARGGGDGTALTLLDPDNQQERMMQVIVSNSEKLFGATRGSQGIQLLPFDLNSVERLRYRVSDVQKSVTKKAVRASRLRDLQQEAVNSTRLSQHFDENPQDLRALQKSQRDLKRGRHIQHHLRYLPEYLVPSAEGDVSLTGVTPGDAVRSAVKQEVEEREGRGENSGRTVLNQDKQQKQRRRLLYNDALAGAMQTGTQGKVRTRKGGKKLITCSMMERIRVDPNADPDTLPPLSGRKIWKMNHGKPLKKKDKSSFGMAGRKMGRQAKRRSKIFHGLGGSK